VGLIAALELVKNKSAKEPFDLKLGLARRCYARLLEEGLICRPILNSLCFSPPLIVNQADVDEIVERFQRGLTKFTDEIVADGTWNP
jgi:adenosylmethionine-8-amino-7-oxononanoate aminotransferase